MTQGTDGDPREAWRRDRAARREERRRRFREKLHAHGLGDLHDMWGDLGLGDLGMGQANGPSTEELLQRIDEMARTIDSLQGRVKVLERLAVHDEARLAAEIEKLRG
jgi:hypothetical protein